MLREVWWRWFIFPVTMVILALMGDGDLVAAQSFDRFFFPNPSQQEGDPVGEMSIVAGLTMGWAHVDPSETSGLGDATGILGAGLPEFAFLCRSRLEPTQYLYNTLPEFRIPGIWLNNITIPMGTWTVQMGSELECQLWECDGLRGCSYFTRGLPDAEVGDDLLGITNIDIDDFKGVSQKDYSVGSSGEGTSAIFRLSCPACSEYVEGNPSALDKLSTDVEESVDGENPAPPPEPNIEGNAIFPAPPPQGDFPGNSVDFTPDPPLQEESTQTIPLPNLSSSSPEESWDLSPSSNTDDQTATQAPGPRNEIGEEGSDGSDKATTGNGEEEIGVAPSTSRIDIDIDSNLEDESGIAPRPEDGLTAGPQATPVPLVTKFNDASGDFPRDLPFDNPGIISNSYTNHEPSPDLEVRKGAAFRAFGGRYSGIKIAGWTLLFVCLVFVVLFVAQRWPGIIPCSGIRAKLARNAEEVSDTLPVSTGCRVSEGDTDMPTIRSNRGHGSLGSFTQEIVLATAPEEVSRLVKKDPEGRPRNVQILSDWKPSL